MGVHEFDEGQCCTAHVKEPARNLEVTGSTR
jgi:hypothetical protein